MNRQNNVSIIGIGRLGLCVSLCLEKSGYNIIGVDICPDYVEKINKKTLISSEPMVTDMLKKSKNFKATTKIEEAIDHSNLIFIYVATPSTGGDRHYDHTTLGKVLTEINRYRVDYKHIVIGCTIIPGYINEIGNFLIKDCTNTSLSYNPEFIAQGDIINGLWNPDFVLIGEGRREAGDRIEEIYKTIYYKKLELYPNSILPPNIHRMSTSSAEITKLAVNCFVTTKIAFANMIGDVADLTPEADKNDILNAVGSDKRIGNKYLKAGLAFGGPCFPRDNRALGGFIQNKGLEAVIPKATDLSNKLHTKFQIEQIYNSRIGDDKTYIINGAGYKHPCSVPIIEESAKLNIGKELVKKGIKVIIRDTKILIDATKLEYGNIFEYEEI